MAAMATCPRCRTPLGPLPVTGGALAGGVLAGALRLVQGASLSRRRRAR